jgi:uncharacterized protein with NAD-binding domain and iron-sulfur cluster
MPIRFPPKTLSQWVDFVKHSPIVYSCFNLNLWEKLTYWVKMLVLCGTSDDRWDSLDKYSFWDFMKADRYSDEYKLMLKSLTTHTVAAKAQYASLKTISRTNLRLIGGIFEDTMDRVLNGPTNDTWIHPWVTHLRSLGVKFHTGMVATKIHLDKSSVAGIELIDREGEITRVTGDYYIASVPAERIISLLSPELKSLAPSLTHIEELRLEWMNGVQYYLKKPMNLVDGHAMYIDSPWAITSINQQQFWSEEYKVSDMGDGSIVDILSIDISDWNTPGYPDGPSKGYPAKNCTKDQVIEEAWYQMHKHRPDIFPSDMYSIVSKWFVDPDIIFDNTTAIRTNENEEPLLINEKHSWSKRPNAITEVSNLFVTGDYVRTNTDLACMEGANESARLAVNGILKAMNRTDYCLLFNHNGFPGCGVLKKMDSMLFKLYSS